VLLQCQKQTEPKDQIVALLGEQFPLTAHKVYNLMKKRYLTATTYHAVYKHLRHLAEEGVLVKNGAEYMLNGEWIKKSREFAVQTEINYGSDLLEGVKGKVEAGMVVPFSSLSEFYGFLNRFRGKFIESADPSKENNICYLGDHSWGPLIYMKDRVDAIGKMQERGIKYTVCVRGNTTLDRCVMKFYKNLGVKDVFCGIKDGGSGVLTLYNDVVLYSMHPPELMRKIDRIFKRTNKTGDVVANSGLMSILNTQSKFYAVIVKDRKMAEHYRGLIGRFSGKRTG